jgi:hypothetical protein
MSDSATNDEILAGMTAEEIELRKQLEEEGAGDGDEGTDDDQDEGGDDDGENEGADGDDAGAADAGDDGAADAGEGDDGQPAGDDAGEQGAATSEPPRAPLLVAEAPADADVKLKEIADKKAELRKQYDDGGITFDEYEAQKDELNDQKTEIELAVREANLAQKLEAQRQQNQWDADCASFLDAHKDHYKGEANVERFSDLNEMIKAIAKMPRYAQLTGPQLLEKAHELTLTARGEAVAKPAPKADAKPAKPAAVPKPNLPPNIGKVPAAAQSDTGEGRFAALEKLDGFALEKALAKMSDADREAFYAQ